MHSAPSRDVDVAIVGGGHNGLVAAAYLARAGYRVAVLERLPHVGGAAVSERPWADMDARVSRYSYLVSLLPRRIVDDLGLGIRLVRRRVSSYTPDPASPDHGLLIDDGDARATAGSFARATGDEREAERFAGFYERLAPLARTVFPTMTERLPRTADMRSAIEDDGLWEAIVQQPLGEHVRASLRTDLARGVVLTDALIGTFASADDASLRQNRCFLYHIIGGGTGDWDVPVGGMGQVSGALRDAALRAGAELVTDAEATAISPDGVVVIGDGERVVHARLVLSGVGEAVLARLLDAAGAGAGNATAAAPEGAQLKVNMLLSRLPRLRDASVDPATAFAGTFHINETMTQLDRAYDDAVAGRLPAPLPAEVYCHSLTDPSILGDGLRASGAQTLTLFGLQVPHRLLAGVDPDARRAELLSAAEASLDAVLAEPIRDVLHVTADGEPCIEARTTLDLERSLGMVGGDIFHGALDWPWADEDDPLDSPARVWGVETAHQRILLCGSSARRGGAVSGIGGHNAAMAALELLSR
ncbi:phytoene desaturase family protein [Microbacterium sp. NPDC058389]|uniref:phytoene desaturase family protein n=1 Tax=Microbacterium sp. NPDC058389 TaxID=3346475 RepID=UPI00365A1E41